MRLVTVRREGHAGGQFEGTDTGDVEGLRHRRTGGDSDCTEREAPATRARRTARLLFCETTRGCSPILPFIRRPS